MQNTHKHGKLARWPSALLLWALSTATACGIPVETAYDHSADFRSYRTFYMWAPNRAVPSAGRVDPFTMRRLRQITYSKVASRGYESVAREHADLVIDVRAEGGSVTEVDPAPYYGYEMGPRRAYAPYPHYYGSQVSTYPTLLVMIDFIDTKRGSVVWHGSTETKLTRKPTDEDLWDLVRAIVDAYPPQL